MRFANEITMKGIRRTTLRAGRVSVLALVCIAGAGCEAMGVRN
jgi:hypothetical protein